MSEFSQRPGESDGQHIARLVRNPDFRRKVIAEDNEQLYNENQRLVLALKTAEAGERKLRESLTRMNDWLQDNPIPGTMQLYEMIEEALEQGGSE